MLFVLFNEVEKTARSFEDLILASDLIHHESHDLLQFEGGRSVSLHLQVATHVGVKDRDFAAKQGGKTRRWERNTGVSLPIRQTTFAHGTCWDGKEEAKMEDQRKRMGMKNLTSLYD